MEKISKSFDICGFSFEENSILDLDISQQNNYNFHFFDDPENQILEIGFHYEKKYKDNRTARKVEDNSDFPSERIADQQAALYLAGSRNSYDKVLNSGKLFVIYEKNDILYISLFLLLISFSLIGCFYI